MLFGMILAWVIRPLDASNVTLAIIR